MSYHDLRKYGATDTGATDDDGLRIFSWYLTATEPDPTNPSTERLKVRTADGQPLRTLSGAVIDRPGWYDFTRNASDAGGDGALFIRRE